MVEMGKGGHVLFPSSTMEQNIGNVSLTLKQSHGVVSQAILLVMVFGAFAWVSLFAIINCIWLNQGKRYIQGQLIN